MVSIGVNLVGYNYCYYYVFTHFIIYLVCILIIKHKIIDVSVVMCVSNDKAKCFKLTLKYFETRILIKAVVLLQISELRNIHMNAYAQMNYMHKWKKLLDEIRTRYLSLYTFMKVTEFNTLINYVTIPDIELKILIIYHIEVHTVYYKTSDLF